MSVSGMVNGMACRDRKTERARRQQGAIGVSGGQIAVVFQSEFIT